MNLVARGCRATVAIALVAVLLGSSGIAVLPSSGSVPAGRIGSLTGNSSLPVATQVLATIEVPSNPYWPVFDSANGNMYVVSSANLATSNPVSVLSGTTDSLVTTVTVGDSPQPATVDPSDGFVYVSNAGSDNVSVISPTTSSVVTTIAVGDLPAPPEYDAQNGDLYVSDGFAANVSVIALSNNTVVRTIPVGSLPLTPVYDRQSDSIYVPNLGSDNLTVISDSTNKVVGSIALEAAPGEPTLDNASGDLYVPLGSPDAGNVSIVSDSTDTVLSTIRVGGEATAGVFDPATGDLYFPEASGLVVVSGESKSVVTSIPVGDDSETPCSTNGGSTLYVANARSDTVSVVSSADNSLLRNISISVVPDETLIGTACDSITGQVFVSVEGSDSSAAVVILGTVAPYTLPTYVVYLLVGATTGLAVGAIVWAVRRRRGRVPARPQNPQQ